MKVDIRTAAARFYDLNPDFPEDIPFYQKMIPSPAASILELGCGTGRVTIPLAGSCSYIHGIDRSSSMIALCQEKLENAKIPRSRAHVAEGDITDFDLGRTFDFIIAPFRVLQNIETNMQVASLMRCIRKHLAPGGTCVLNVFRPFYAPHELRERWTRLEEQLSWEVPIRGGKVACFDRRPRVDEDNFILFPELIYRRFEGERLAEEAVLKLVMRCYDPETFEEMIRKHGFKVLQKWGGYAAESYGEGPELVIQFT